VKIRIRAIHISTVCDDLLAIGSWQDDYEIAWTYSSLNLQRVDRQRVTAKSPFGQYRGASRLSRDEASAKPALAATVPRLSPTPLNAHTRTN
jgi:hypothetical protein